MDTLLPQKPENYTQLIKRSLILYQASFMRVVILSFLLSLLIFIPRLMSDIIGQDIFLHLNPLDPHRIWLFVINVGGLILFLSILWRLHGVISHIKEPLKEDLTLGVKKVFYVLVAALLQSAILFSAAAILYGSQLLIHQYLLPSSHFFVLSLLAIIFILQFFIIVYLYTLFVFLFPLIAIENKSVLSALKRSVYLVWDHWWRTFSLQITPWCVYLFLLFLCKYLLGIDIHIYFIEHTPHSFWSTLFHVILFTLFIPWIATLLLVQLKDLELRKKIIENAYV